MNGRKSTPAQRWLSLAVFVLAPIAVIVVYAFRNLHSLPRALRVWVPRDRPGVPAPKPPKDWARLRYLAGIPKLRPGHRIDRR